MIQATCADCGADVQDRELTPAPAHLPGLRVDPEPLPLADAAAHAARVAPGIVWGGVAMADQLRAPVADDSADTAVYVDHVLVCPLRGAVLDRLAAPPSVQDRMARHVAGRRAARR